MLRLYYILFHGCDHVLQPYQQTTYKGNGITADIFIVTNRCEKCGRMFNHRINP